MPHAIGSAAGLQQALRRGWGHEAFRPLQLEAVQGALAGRDCLVVLPTGGGKSLCYQLPAALRDGLVLVISPLISLMDDQVAAARRAGLAADALHSGLDEASRGEARRRLEEGRTRLLYLSPERLLAGGLPPSARARLALAAVDEAHCISHWGHEFRPEYRCLAGFLERVPWAGRMALTATATPAVQDDICAQLALRSPLRLIGDPDRGSLLYRVQPRGDCLLQVLEVARRHAGEGGIVYARTRLGAERLAAGLSDAGVACAAYHAGLPAEERRRVQEDFTVFRRGLVAATVAFGMGIDRPDVRFVVHADAPASLDHYQQEAGRAGHDGLPAECVLLYAVSDLLGRLRLLRRDRGLGVPRRREAARGLRGVAAYATAAACRHRLLAEYFGAAYQRRGGCGACDHCLGETGSLGAWPRRWLERLAAGLFLRA